jgi:hypothetical protein
MQALSRLMTPAAMNVNVSRSVYPGWDQAFSSYWKFWLVLTLAVGASLWILGKLFSLLWPAADPDPTSAPPLGDSGPEGASGQSY